LPPTAQYEPHDHERHPDYHPEPPANGAMPTQERGTRPSRATGYALAVRERSSTAGIDVTFLNSGKIGAHFQARFLTPAAPPASYTVGAGDQLGASWPAAGRYDITVHGPQGLFRRFAGNRSADHVRAAFRGHGHRISVVVTSLHEPATVTLTSAYRPQHPHRVHLAPGKEHEFALDARGTGGWYDLTLAVEGEPFVRQYAGHLEDGGPSISDPQLGG